MTIQLAAGDAPYVTRHAMSPPMRLPPIGTIALELPGAPLIAARCLAANVASHTVRKQRTCLHRPPATASIAARPAPPGRGASTPPLIQEGRTRSASSIA